MMMYNFNVEFHIIGIALLGMLLSMSDWGRTVRAVSNKAYLILFIESFASIILDIISIVTTNLNRFLPVWVTPLSCRLYLLSLVIVAEQILKYVTIQAHPDGMKEKWPFISMDAAMLLFGIGIFFAPVYAYYDAKSVFILGMATEICGIGAVVFILIAIAETAMFWTSIGGKKRNAILFTTCGTLIIALIQFLYHQLEITSLYLGMSMVYIFFSLENPHDYIDKSSGAMSKMALEMYMKEHFRNGRRFSLIAIHFYELRYLRNLFGSEKYDIFRRKLTEYLSEFEGSSVYISDENELMVLFEKRESFENARKEIGDRFRSLWEIEGISFEVKQSMLIIPEVNMPESFEEARILIDYFKDKLMRGPVGNTLYVGITEMSEKLKNDRINDLLKIALKEERISSSYQLIYDKDNKKPVAVETMLRILGNQSGEEYLDNHDIFRMTGHDGLINEIA